MPGLVEPVPVDLRRALRSEVLALKTAERRLRFTPRIHVGTPGGDAGQFPASSLDEPGELDDALRTELISTLLVAARGGDHTTVPLVWLTRPGALSWHDLDAVWLPAAIRAYSEAGVPLTMVVVTKHGWYDPRSDVRREWIRLRAR